MLLMGTWGRQWCVNRFDFEPQIFQGGSYAFDSKGKYIIESGGRGYESDCILHDEVRVEE